MVVRGWRWPAVAVTVLALGGAQLVAACGGTGSGPAPAASVGPPRPATVADVFAGALQPQDFGSFGLERVSVVGPDEGSPGPALRVRYPAGSASNRSVRNDDTVPGGAQLYLRWRSGPVDEAYLRYHVRFPAGFDFVKGGKLPGLYGGRVTGGRRIPDGADGFSTRFMWRRHGVGEVYAYLPTSSEHGTSLGRGVWNWPTGTWFSVQQRVRLNTPGRADGEIQVWLDGRPVLHQRALTFRDSAELRIDGVFFSTFFGGGDRSWATPRDQYADFAGFAVSSSYIAG